MGWRLAEFAEALELENITLVAHSLGGHVAINALSKMTPAALFLFGTPPLKKPFDPSAFLPNPNGRALMQAISSDEEINLLMKELNYSGDILEQSILDYKKADPQARVSIFSNVLMNEHLDESVLLKNYGREVMFLISSHETILNNQYILTEAQTRKFSSIEAGHSPQVESAEVFNRILADFCEHVYSKQFLNHIPTISTNKESLHDH